MAANGALAIELKETPSRRSASRSHLRLVYDKRRYEPLQKKSPMQSRDSQNSFLRLLVAFALVAGIVSVAVGNVQNDAVCKSLSDAQAKSVAVMPGDTLWSIAERYAVEGVSTYDEVQWIRTQNDLSTGELRVGTKIVVPS